MITTFIFDSWGMTNKIVLSNVLCGWFEIVFKLQSAQKAWKTLSDYRLIHLFLVTQTIRSGWHLQKIRKNGDIKKLTELQPILILSKQLRKITMLQSKLVTIWPFYQAYLYISNEWAMFFVAINKWKSTTTYK